MTVTMLVIIGMTTVLGASVASATTTTVTVLGTNALTDTGIALSSGESVSITATGTINIGNASTPNSGNEYPAGSGMVSADRLHCSAPGAAAVESVPFPLGNEPCWSLIGQIGSGALFEIGASYSFTAGAAGELYLGPNDNALGDNSGSWTATVTTPSPAILLTIAPGMSPPTANAASSSGAAVTFTTPVASDTNGPVGVTCDHPSGSTFAIGQTTVTCTASQAGDTPPSVQTSLVVTVTDPTLAITGASPPPVRALGPNIGAPVTFVPPSAHDLQGTVPVTCDQPSGSWFAIGPTTVNCSATRAGDSPSTVTTTLTVLVYVPATMPNPPVIDNAAAGNAAGLVSFDPPLYNGSAVVTSYNASCTSNDGGTARSASSQFSPILVLNLTNGSDYSCTVTATNSVGTSAPSDASNTFQPGPGGATCTNTTTCNAKSTSGQSAKNPSVSVVVTGTPTDPVGTVETSTAPAALNCPGVPPAITAVTTLTDTGFPANTSLAATVTQFAVATGPGMVCYSSDVPFLSVTNPTIPTAGTFLLLQCSAVGNLAPCQVSSKQTQGTIVVKLLLPGGDPLFKVVVPTGRLVWPSSFPTGKVGTAYAGHLQSSGGKAPVHWKIASGKLPPGLSLNASSGAISGTPKSKGVFTSVARVTDSASPPQTASINVSITIK